MQKLFNTSEKDTYPIGYVYRSGGTMADLVRAVKCFLGSLEAGAPVQFFLWPTATDLKSMQHYCLFASHSKFILNLFNAGVFLFRIQKHQLSHILILGFYQCMGSTGHISTPTSWC